MIKLFVRTVAQNIVKMVVDNVKKNTYLRLKNLRAKTWKNYINNVVLDMYNSIK